MDFGNAGKISHRSHPPDAELISKSSRPFARRCARWQTEDGLGERPDVRRLVGHASRSKSATPILRGLGGAGIPAVQKWRDVRDAVRKARQRESDDRAFIVVNGDESEPGTFKDRELLLRTPHLIVEAVILAGLITEATQGFIYIRHEYAEQIEACRNEIRRAEQLGLCGENAMLIGRSLPISVFVSPGGYICGEQSALIEAMSDRRGEPRNMPPKLETNGLEDLPTLVSNVETFAWVPFICLNSGKAYAEQGVNGWKGRRIFSVSGDVKRPGVYEVPMGLTLRELIYGEKLLQGIAGDKKLKGFAPSGPSGGFLPAKLTAGKGLPRDHTNNKSWQALAARRGFDPAASRARHSRSRTGAESFSRAQSDAGAGRRARRVCRGPRHGGSKPSTRSSFFAMNRAANACRADWARKNWLRSDHICSMEKFERRRLEG